MSRLASPLQAICLAGPTGSGKTEMAVNLARYLDCEIINADSRQIYRDFPIITAQPGPSEKAAAEHHLYGFLDSSESLSAGEWARMTLPVMEKIRRQGKIPILTGGTGFYFHALLNGLAQIPKAPQNIRELTLQEMEANGVEKSMERLRKIDPEYCAKIHANDRQRIARALEVFEATGKTFTWWHKNSKPAPLCQGPLFLVDISINELEPRLKKRVDDMMERGALREAEKALENCACASAPAWKSIGCKELLQFLNGSISLAECADQWKKNTRAYAKRQITWFKAQKDAIKIKNADDILRHPALQIYKNLSF